MFINNFEQLFLKFKFFSQRLNIFFSKLNINFFMFLFIWRLIYGSIIRNHSSISGFSKNIVELKPIIRKTFESIRSLPLIKSSLIISGGYIIWSNTRRAKCDFQVDDIVLDSNDQNYVSIKKSNSDQNIYPKLWFFLKPDTLYLIVAITVSLNSLAFEWVLNSFISLKLFELNLMYIFQRVH